MESRSQSDDNSMTSLYLKREKGKEDKRVSSSSRVSISKRDLYIVWLRLLRINHVDFSRSGLSISHHHRQRKSILSLSFLFFPTQAFVQSRYKKKRVCPGLRSSLGRSFCTSTHTFRSHLYSSSSSKASPKSSSPPWCVVLGERRRERETQRARARRKKEREIQKKTERKTPRTEQKTREETL